MRPILLLLCVLLASSALAGCSGKPAAAPADTQSASTVTDPRDLRNGTAPGSHIHDYWGGRDHVQVLKQTSSGSSTCSGSCGEMAFSWARPDEGAIVPQGTKWVNGTFGLQSDGNDQYDRLELWVKTAKDHEAQRWGPLVPGQPFSINGSQEADDPPHYVLSLWVFQVRAIGSSDTLHVGGTWTWNVEAVRGLPLVPYPPHPDRWDGNPELPLLTESRSTQLIYQTESPQGGTSTSCYSGCLGVHSLPNGTVVPFDANHVTVRLKVDQGTPAGIGLWYHGADTWKETKATGASLVPGETVYTIPITGAMGDSPYAPQSLWEFEVALDQPQPYAQAWTGSYTLTVTAFHDPA
jgi:hypothetical protein